MRDISGGIPKAEVEAIVKARPGITTPEIAEALDVSVSVARWAVSHCTDLEFYEGNRIRLKQRGVVFPSGPFMCPYCGTRDLLCPMCREDEV